MAALFHLTYVISKPIIKALGVKKKTGRGRAEKHIYILHKAAFFFCFQGSGCYFKKISGISERFPFISLSHQSTKFGHFDVNHSPENRAIISSQYHFNGENCLGNIFVTL